MDFVTYVARFASNRRINSSAHVPIVGCLRRRVVIVKLLASIPYLPTPMRVHTVSGELD